MIYMNRLAKVPLVEAARRNLIEEEGSSAPEVLTIETTTYEPLINTWEPFTNTWEPLINTWELSPKTWERFRKTAKRRTKTAERRS
ncbi:MAG: hypothetical protein LBG24_07065 [Treponema sp.]|jgi:hypothetical protein|nr:hypothetical protein [Treponema sp.]